MTPSSDYVGHLLGHQHTILAIRPAKPATLGFEAICSCGYRVTRLTTSRAHSAGWYHVQRWKWRSEDAAWLDSIRADYMTAPPIPSYGPDT